MCRSHLVSLDNCPVCRHSLFATASGRGSGRRKVTLRPSLALRDSMDALETAVKMMLSMEKESQKRKKAQQRQQQQHQQRETLPLLDIIVDEEEMKNKES